LPGKHTTRLRYRYASYLSDIKSPYSYIKSPERYSKHNLQGNLKLQITNHIVLNYTFTWIINGFNSRERSLGYLVSQDIAYDHPETPFSSRVRIAHFDTDSYISRIYLYEHDVAGLGSMPAYYGKGFRFYWLLKFRILKKLDFWIRYAIFIFPDEHTIGSGHDLIRGNKKSEIKLQCRLKI